MSKSLNEIFFHLLWAKDKACEPFSSALLPDTVIYQYALPRYWYFTSKSGLIMKKSNQNLNERQIFETFIKKISDSGIVAMLMYIEEGQHIVDYLDLVKFERFIKLRKKNNEMILQKFIDPQGERNTCYTVIWTSNLTVFEKKENKQLLYLKKDHSYDKKILKKTQKQGKKESANGKSVNNSIEHYERAVTFDGKDFHVNTSPIFGTLLPARLQRTADFLASHLSSATLQKSQLTTMMIQFKLDPKSRLWVLCATSLHFSNDSSPSNPLFSFTPSKDTNFKNLTLDKRNPARFCKDSKCSICFQMHESSKVVKFTYKEILNVYKKDLILNIMPKANEDEEENFEALKTKPEFLARILFICFECYTQFVEETKKPLGLPNIRRAVSQKNLLVMSAKDHLGGLSLNSPISELVESSLIGASSNRVKKSTNLNVTKGLPTLKY